MEALFENPGFSHIAENIFMFLDHDSLMSCQNVCKSWAINLDSIFWLKKCAQKGLPKPIEKMWKEIIHATIGTNFEDNVISLLIKIHEEKSLQLVQPPIHIASRFGDFTLVQYMLQNHMEQSLVLDELNNR